MIVRCKRRQVCVPPNASFVDGCGWQGEGAPGGRCPRCESEHVRPVHGAAGDVVVFWEGQGWHLAQAGVELPGPVYDTLDLATRGAHDRGYAIVDVMRTRGQFLSAAPK